MSVDEKICALVDRCKCSVNISFNEHRDYYEPVATYVKDYAESIESPVMERMIATDTVISIQFYPTTAIGFYRVFHFDLDAALDEALAALKGAK